MFRKFLRFPGIGVTRGVESALMPAGRPSEIESGVEDRYGKWSGARARRAARTASFIRTCCARWLTRAALCDVPPGPPGRATSPQPAALRLPPGAPAPGRLGVPVAQRAGRASRVSARVSRLPGACARRGFRSAARSGTHVRQSAGSDRRTLRSHAYGALPGGPSAAGSRTVPCSAPDASACDGLTSPPPRTDGVRTLRALQGRVRRRTRRSAARSPKRSAHRASELPGVEPRPGLAPPPAL